MVEVGDVVKYVDELKVEHNALIVCVHRAEMGHPGATDDYPAVNLVYVVSDKEKEDSWGRQIERDASVVHKTNQSAGGNYWV